MGETSQIRQKKVSKFRYLACCFPMEKYGEIWHNTYSKMYPGQGGLRMNSFTRVMNRFQGKPVDRVPNLSIVMMFAAKEQGITYGQYCSDYRLRTDAVFRCHERYGIDMVCAISDPMCEAEGFGTQVVIPDDAVPYPAVRRLQTLSDIDTLRVIDPSQARRMSDRVEAVRLMRQRAGNDVPVVGWIEGALAECCDLMRMEEVFINMIDEPEAIKRLIDICVEQGILFAKAQIEAGAHIVGMGDAATSLIGPGLYEEFVLPYQQKMIRAIHDMGAKVKLHICGNIGPVMDLVAQTGADMVDCDFMVDMERVAGILPESTCICGNFNPVQILYQGTPEMVKAEVRRCKKLSGRTNHFVAPGCEVPKDTPVENMLALLEALEEPEF